MLMTKAIFQVFKNMMKKKKKLKSKVANRIDKNLNSNKYYHAIYV